MDRIFANRRSVKYLSKSVGHTSSRVQWNTISYILQLASTDAVACVLAFVVRVVGARWVEIGHVDVSEVAPRQENVLSHNFEIIKEEEIWI
jgi:hypothetical protein